MGLETGTYISDLVATNPTLGDPVSAGDDHLRLIKSAVKNSFPNISGAVSASHAELSHLVGVTSGVQSQLNAKSAVGHTHTESEIADGSLLARVGSNENVTGAWTFEQPVQMTRGVVANQGDQTWATFNKAAGASTPLRVGYENLDYAVNGRKWMDYFQSNYYGFYALSDDSAVTKPIFIVYRDGTTLLNLQYGNATDSPYHYFYGIAQFNNGLIASDAIIGGISNAELQMLDGISANIQAQLNGKAATSHSHDDLYYTEAEVNALLAALTSSGSFTMSLRASSPSGTILATGTAYWKKTGNVVTLKVPPNFWGLSSLGGTFYATGLPAEIQIASSGTAQLNVAVTDNGTVKSGFVVIGGANPDSMSIGCFQSGGFTASSGNKGFNYQSSLTYAVST